MKSAIEKYNLLEINFAHYKSDFLNFDHSYPSDFLEEFRDVVEAKDWYFTIKRIVKECYYK